VSKRNNDDQESKVSIQRFAGILAHQLINLAEKQKGSKYLPEDDEEKDLGFILSTLTSKNDLSSPTLTTSHGVTADANCALRKGSGEMLSNTVLPVEKATVHAIIATKGIALVSISRTSNESQGKWKKK
jgi:hypothetical protein